MLHLHIKHHTGRQAHRVLHHTHIQHLLHLQRHVHRLILTKLRHGKDWSKIKLQTYDYRCRDIDYHINLDYYK